MLQLTQDWLWYVAKLMHTPKHGENRKDSSTNRMGSGKAIETFCLGKGVVRKKWNQIVL